MEVRYEIIYTSAVYHARCFKMSIKLMTAVWEREDLSSTHKLVLLALADWANDEGLCWPSINRLAIKTSMTGRGVQKTIRSLEQMGFVRREEESGKGNRYWVSIPMNDVHPCTIFTPALNDIHPTPEPCSDNTSETHHLITNNTSIQEDDAPVTQDEVLEYWNTIAGRIGLPKISKLTPARRQKLQARIKEFPDVESWSTAFQNIERSPFLRGDNDRGWKANFDFLLQPGSFVKLIEGVYNNG